MAVNSFAVGFSLLQMNNRSK